ncbi:uncharacterized protein LOC130996777 isoform X1 [Salvia miltiorrhiza]|uniref:uncharacterized protein LOC130996777 isoform X1 n=1 Tax=Salvia miltiorrhiza TaxID=226208 RepID=UPI0025AB7AF0|nr:uncharacterized protein LOC130996777 isoform X1 [Salvia miltiorrhiza]XP_057778064.1 uncharacterized protein LOC130996777 isoform X1 [Salvia miltiorrhiza]
MEGGKQSGSSLASDLFGAKDKDSSAASSSSGIFGSLFPPPPKVVGGEWHYYSETEKKIPKADRNGEDQKAKEEQQQQPFHYSSSIYYGAQDVYSPPKTEAEAEAEAAQTTFNKDNGQDDSTTASRGNWWQGINIYIIYRQLILNFYNEERRCLATDYI